MAQIVVEGEIVKVDGETVVLRGKIVQPEQKEPRGKRLVMRQCVYCWKFYYGSHICWLPPNER